MSPIRTAPAQRTRKLGLSQTRFHRSCRQGGRAVPADLARLAAHSKRLDISVSPPSLDEASPRNLEAGEDLLAEELWLERHRCVRDWRHFRWRFGLITSQIHAGKGLAPSDSGFTIVTAAGNGEATTS